MKRIILLLTVISVIAFQSCKKDEFTNPDRTSKVYNTESSSFNPRAIDDMDSYLTNFLKEIKSPTRDAQPMSVEDAQWHLSACLNFQFCNANVNKTQVTYDTLYSSIQINNGKISLDEINNSIQTISNDVRTVYDMSALQNKNILFINPEIIDGSTRGNAMIRTVVAITDNNLFGNYYFNNDSTPLSLFDEDDYDWREAASILDYCINIFKPEMPTDPNERIYYITLESIDLYYNDCYINVEPYNRLYVCGNCTMNARISKEFMVYYLDSYLGLIRENLPQDGQSSNVSSTVLYHVGNVNNTMGLVPIAPQPIHHSLTAFYGVCVITEIPPVIN